MTNSNPKHEKYFGKRAWLEKPSCWEVGMILGIEDFLYHLVSVPGMPCNVSFCFGLPNCIDVGKLNMEGSIM